MDPIAKLRQEKHMEYRRQNWLPIFFEKYKLLFDKKNRAGKVIVKFCIKHILKPVVNNTFINDIPGIFRYRVLLNDSNLTKQKVNISNKSTSVTKPTQHTPLTNLPVRYPVGKHPINQSSGQSMIQQAFEESRRLAQSTLLQYDHHMENDDDLILQQALDESTKMNHQNDLSTESPEEIMLQKALEESIRQTSSNNKTDNKPINHINDDIQDIIKESLDMSYDEQLADAINKSLSDGKLPESKLPESKLPESKLPESKLSNTEQKKNNGFYYCLDLRIYGQDPNGPIYHNNVMYYLNHRQIDKIKNIWNQINPNTSNGQRYKQNMEFTKCLSNDSFHK